MSENQVSSTTTSGVRGLPLNITAAIEEVITTLLMEETFAHDLSTLSVPLTAGSRSSVCGSETDSMTGDAVWKTHSQPSMAESKDPSSVNSALKK